MATVVCPCCRASNETGPNCRRCTADLGLLFQLETDRQALLAQAGYFITQGRVDEAMPLVEQAQTLRTGEEIHRLRAIAQLMIRDYPNALRSYQLAKSSPRP